MEHKQDQIRQEQILICIDEQFVSKQVIDAGISMANKLGAKAIAIYIETPRTAYLSKEAERQLAKNMNRIELLGGEVVVMHGEDEAEEIIRYAKLNNITKILIAKEYSIRKTPERWKKNSVVDKLLMTTQYIDIYIISTPKTFYQGESLEKKYLSAKFKCRKLDWIKSIGILLIATLLALILQEIGFADENMMMVYTIAVLFISIETRGYTIGILSSIVATLCYNFLFLQPQYTFSVYDYSYVVTIIIVSLTTTMLTTKIQEQASLYAQREKYTQMLYGISRSFLYLSGEENIITYTLEKLSTGLKKNVVYYEIIKEKNINNFYQRGYLAKEREEIDEEDELECIQWIIQNGKEAGRGTNIFPASKRYYMPIKGKKEILGIVGIEQPQEKIDRESQSFIQTIIAQVVLVLERERLSKEQEEDKIEIERERLRGNLLRAISHDLRTPLTGISGASSLILDKNNEIEEIKKRELIEGIYEDSEWLIRLVENLLSMTKIEEGKLIINKTQEIMEEIVGEAVRHTRKRMGKHELKVALPETIIMAPMDGKLIEQVLINLIDNAIKYTHEEATITIEISEREQEIICKVSDNGPGIPEEAIPYLFNRFYTIIAGSVDGRRGVGLGLAICKSIIEAHQGRISVHNQTEGGAQFSFTLPKIEKEVEGKQYE
ncbi:MAG: ATP-binding protein [Cellulosilyticaceae bacterium]